jgi:hypothetical protein
MMTRLTSLIIFSSVLLAVPVEEAFAGPSEQFRDATSFEFNPPDDGMPSNTTGGASRPTSTCLMRQGATQASNITFLAPSTFVGLTVSARPEFLLYVDQTLAQQIFVSIQDVDGDSVYQGFQALPATSGVLRVSLPDDAPALEQDRTYQIAMVPICEASLRPDDPALVAYVKRVSPVLPTGNVSQDSAIAIVQQYAEAGIWYDTLVVLEQALMKDPEDQALQTAWDTLLRSGGFSEVVFHRAAF